MGQRESRVPKDAEVEVTELRRLVQCHTGGYAISANENDVTGSVELWIDPPVLGERPPAPAVANLRMTPENARILADGLLIAAERAEKAEATS